MQPPFIFVRVIWRMPNSESRVALKATESHASDMGRAILG